MTEETVVDLGAMQKIVRNSYLIILPNVVWLLIPLFALLTGNNLSWIMAALILACVFLNISNVYLAVNWYYNQHRAKGTAYEGHFRNIDDIGFVTFFVTMISALLFLMVSVIITNLFKSKAGVFMNYALEIALTAVLIALAFWVVKRASVGLRAATKGEGYVVDPNAKLFGVFSAGT